MRKFVLLGLTVLAVGVLASTASADPPLFHEVKVPFSGTNYAPAGFLCDFGYQQVYSGTDTFTFLSDGRVEILEQGQDTNTNLDTGVSLHESISYHYTFYPDGSFTQVGIFWKLRDATGKLVVVHAGDVVFDPSYNLVKFTPNSSPDFAAVICPALGGNSA